MSGIGVMGLRLGRWIVASKTQLCGGWALHGRDGVLASGNGYDHGHGRGRGHDCDDGWFEKMPS